MANWVVSTKLKSKKTYDNFLDVGIGIVISVSDGVTKVSGLRVCPPSSWILFRMNLARY